MLSATASTPHHTIEIQPPVPQSPAVEGPSTLAIEMSRTQGTGAVQASTVTNSDYWKNLTPEQHRQIWRNKLKKSALYCTASASAATGCLALITLSAMGAANKGPMYVNRSCSMVNATATHTTEFGAHQALNTSAISNVTQLFEECHANMRMQGAIGVSMTFSTILLVASAITALFTGLECIDHLRNMIQGNPYRPTPITPVRYSTTSDNASIDNASHNFNPWAHQYTQGGGSHCGGGGG